MAHYPDPPADRADALLRGSLLSPAVRRDVADLNRRYLELTLSAELATDPRFAWSDPVRRELLETDESTRDRMAASPFTFFELRLPPVEAMGPAVAGRVEDAEVARTAGAMAGRCVAFVHLALFVAWRLADAAPLATRIVLGLQPAAELQLNEMSLSQLMRLAPLPDLIRPRWPAHRHFWAMLAGASRSSSVAGLQWAHCSGICLLESTEAGAAAPRGERDPGRRPRR